MGCGETWVLRVCGRDGETDGKDLGLERSVRERKVMMTYGNNGDSKVVS